MILALMGLITYHEIVCAEGQLISEVVDEWLESNPVAVYVFTLITVAHLLNWLPPLVDPYHLVGHLFTKLKGTI